MIIKATGQLPFEKLVSYNELQNRNGKITIDENGITNWAKVFAGGDCVNGGKEVVDAVQAGKDAAKGILNLIMKTD
jgi:glutamate synthase (NADPH/NADH) small chain